MNFKDLEEIYEAEKIPYKNAKSKNFDSYRKNSSRLVNLNLIKMRFIKKIYQRNFNGKLFRRENQQRRV